MKIKKIPIVSGFFLLQCKAGITFIEIRKPYAQKSDIKYLRSNIIFNHYFQSACKHRLLF